MLYPNRRSAVLEKFAYSIMTTGAEGMPVSRPLGGYESIRRTNSSGSYGVLAGHPDFRPSTPLPRAVVVPASGIMPGRTNRTMTFAPEQITVGQPRRVPGQEMVFEPVRVPDRRHTVAQSRQPVMTNYDVNNRQSIGIQPARIARPQNYQTAANVGEKQSVIIPGNRLVGSPNAGLQAPRGLAGAGILEAPGVRVRAGGGMSPIAQVASNLSLNRPNMRGVVPINASELMAGY